jgi:UPF0271 protein
MVLEGKVTAINGKEIPIIADSICVHGDNPQAVALAKAIKDTLQESGVRVMQLREKFANS